MGGLSCDYEPVDVYERKTRVAKKQHVCDECKGEIKPGDQYEDITILYDGAWFHYRMCDACTGVFDWASQHGYCPEHGGLLEVLWATDFALDYMIDCGPEVAIPKLLEAGMTQRAAEHIVKVMGGIKKGDGEEC